MESQGREYLRNVGGPLVHMLLADTPVTCVKAFMDDRIHDLFVGVTVLDQDFFSGSIRGVAVSDPLPAGVSLDVPEVPQLIEDGDAHNCTSGQAEQMAYDTVERLCSDSG